MSVEKRISGLIDASAAHLEARRLDHEPVTDAEMILNQLCDSQVVLALMGKDPYHHSHPTIELVVRPRDDTGKIVTLCLEFNPKQNIPQLKDQGEVEEEVGVAFQLVEIIDSVWSKNDKKRQLLEKEWPDYEWHADTGTGIRILNDPELLAQSHGSFLTELSGILSGLLQTPQEEKSEPPR